MSVSTPFHVRPPAWLVWSCVFLKSLDSFLQVKLICLSNLPVPYRMACHAVLNRLTARMTMDNAEPSLVVWQSPEGLDAPPGFWMTMAQGCRHLGCLAVQRYAFFLNRQFFCLFSTDFCRVRHPDTPPSGSSCRCSCAGVCSCRCVSWRRYPAPPHGSLGKVPDGISIRP